MSFDWQDQRRFELESEGTSESGGGGPRVAPGKRSLTMGIPPRSAPPDAGGRGEGAAAIDSGASWRALAGLGGGGGAVQAKLALDAPDSPSERAAEEAGGAVARGGDRGGGAAEAGAGAGGLGALAAAPLASGLGRYAGGGQALAAAVRAPFEDAYATDLSSVQVHTGDGAERLSRSLGARAVTSGNHVFFGRGHFAPDHDDGRALLGHELAHVVQQQGHGGVVQCATDPDAVRDTRVLPELKFEGGGEHQTVLEVMAHRDQQVGGVVRDANANNLAKRRFEDALATFVFNRWDLIGDVVLKVSGRILEYVTRREEADKEKVLTTMKLLMEAETTLGYPGFVPESADHGAKILLDQIPTSLPAHLNVHGKMSYRILAGEQGDFQKDGIAAKVLGAMGLRTDDPIGTLMPEALFGAPDQFTDDPERGRPRKKNDKDVREKATYVSGLEPRSENQQLNVKPVVTDRGSGKKRPTHANQVHGRGGDAFFLDETKRWTQEARLLYDMPVMAGPSGSAAYMLNTAVAMGLGPGELQLYTMALIGSVVGGGHHSFHEIMTVAALAGVPYTPGDYLSVIPARFWQDDEFNQLVGHFFEDAREAPRHGRDGGKTKKEIGQDLQFGLTPVADDGDLVSLRKHLASRLPPEMEVTWDEIGLKPINEGNQASKGVSGAPVFTVIVRGKVIGVLKAFTDFGEMAQEMSAMEELGRLGIKGLDGPQVMGVGKLVKGGKGGKLVKDGEMGLLLSTVAPGEPLDDLMENLGKAKQDRQEHFQRLCQAVTDVGLRLADLHTKPKGSGGLPGMGFIETHIKKVVDYAKDATQSEWARQHGLDIDLTKLVQPIWELFAKDPGPAAMVHGDAHPGNFFHQESGGVTAIDTPTMDLSIGPEDRPLGSPARDYMNFARKLETVGRPMGLLQEEVQALQELFLRAYHERTGGKTISKPAERFFLVRTLLSELRTAIQDKDEVRLGYLLEELKKV